MVRRKGLGAGKGKGYKNILPTDKKVHAQSARGVKQPQRVSAIQRPNNIISKTEKAGWRELPMKSWSMNPNIDHVRSYSKGDEVVSIRTSPSAGIIEVWKLNLKTKKKTKVKEFSDSFQGHREALSQAHNLMGITDEGLPKSKKLEKNLSMKDKKLVTKELGLPDTDGDGVANQFDCEPNNPKKQDSDANFTEVDDFVKNAEKEKAPLWKKGLWKAKEWKEKYEQDKEEHRNEMMNLSENELRTLAERWVDDSFFGSDNPYEDELVRRRKERLRLAGRLKEADREAKEAMKKGKERGFFDDLF